MPTGLDPAPSEPPGETAVDAEVPEGARPGPAELPRAPQAPIGEVLETGIGALMEMTLAPGGGPTGQLRDAPSDEAATEEAELNPALLALDIEQLLPVQIAQIPDAAEMVARLKEQRLTQTAKNSPDPTLVKALTQLIDADLKDVMSLGFVGLSAQLTELARRYEAEAQAESPLGDVMKQVRSKLFALIDRPPEELSKLSIVQLDTDYEQSTLQPSAGGVSTYEEQAPEAGSSQGPSSSNRPASLAEPAPADDPPPPAPEPAAESAPPPAPPAPDPTPEPAPEPAPPPPAPVNDAPTTDAATASGVEDAASIAVTLSGNDVDGTVQSFALSSLPNGGTLYTDAGLTTLAATGTDYPASGGSLTLYFVPDADFSGTATFDYAATDDTGASDASPATASITVTAINDAPTTDAAAPSGAEDAASIAVTLTGADVDGTVQSFALSSLPADGTLYTDAGLTTLAAAGIDYVAPGGSLTLYFVPDADFNGAASFDYAAKDDGGASDASPASATITVTAVNDAPITNDDTVATNEDTAVVVSVLTNDSDSDLGDVLSITGITQGANGTVVDNGDGTLTYTPNLGFIGNDSFTYTISDGNGGTDTATVAVTVVNGILGTPAGETLNGTAGDDAIFGFGGDDTLNGLGGDDTLSGNAGADALDGGAGTDTASYSGSAAGVTVNLASGTGTGGDAQGDTLINVENLTGSAFADTLTGDGNANTLTGGAGDDTLIGGGGGDTLIGGTGNDTVSYANAASGVTASLTNGLTISSTADATLGGLSFGDDDLANYDSMSDTATLSFDGDALFSSTSEDIDAVHILSNGHIILSTATDATLGGVSFGDDDLVDYDPVTGIATVYFDGGALFSSSSEDIEAVHVLSNGHIVLSTDGNATLGGLTFGDDDLVDYDPFTDTSTLLFDGGALFSSSSENIDAVHVLSDGHIVLSTKGDATLGGLSFGDDDLVEYDPVSDTATLFFDGGVLFSNTSEDVDAAHITEPGGAGDSYDGIENLTGSAFDDALTGDDNANTLMGGAGADTLNGGGGDDTLVWDAADTAIDGGAGSDTLRVDSGDVDLTAFGGTIGGIETIDLEVDAGANTLTLTAADILSLSDNDILNVLGDAGDTLNAGTGWTDNGFDGSGNHVYSQVVGVDTLSLVVDPDMTVNLV